MVTKSKLRLALAAEKGIDLRAVKQKRKNKDALKQKKQKSRSNAAAGSTNGTHSDEEVDEEHSGVDEADSEDGEAAEKLGMFDLEAIDDSETSDSSVGMEERIPRARATPKNGSKSKYVQGPKISQEAEGESTDEDEEEGEEDEDEEDIPMSDLEDLEDADREDLIPHSRLTINNTAALTTCLNRISIPRDTFASHQSVTSKAPTADSIPDVSDDLKRELAFYSQCLDAANEGRAKLLTEGVPFSRPNDYFAEMVKEDAHMEKVRAKMVEEAAAKKASAEARKQRDLKKFGKQVQIAKLQERQKAKREALDKIKLLKRKRQESSGDLPDREGDIFDVAVDEEMDNFKRGRPGAGDRQGDRVPNAKRQKKNEKFGFGGKKRHSKSGDAMSSAGLGGFGTRKTKGGSFAKVGKQQRPGKSKRKAMGSR